MSNAVTTNEVSETEAVGRALQHLDAHRGPVSPTLYDVAHAAGMKGRCLDFSLAFRAATGMGFRQYWLTRNPAALA